MKVVHYSIALFGLFLAVQKGHGLFINGMAGDGFKMMQQPCFPFCNDVNPAKSLPSPPHKTHNKHHRGSRKTPASPSKPIAVDPKPEPMWKEPKMTMTKNPTQDDLFWSQLTQAVNNQQLMEVLRILIAHFEEIVPGIKTLLELAVGAPGSPAKQIDLSDPDSNSITTNRDEAIRKNDNRNRAQVTPSMKAIEWYPSSDGTDYSTSWKPSEDDNLYGTSGQQGKAGTVSWQSSKDDNFDGTPGLPGQAGTVSWQSNEEDNLDGTPGQPGKASTVSWQSSKKDNFDGTPGQPGKAGTVSWQSSEEDNFDGTPGLPGKASTAGSSNSGAPFKYTNQVRHVENSKELQEALNTVKSHTTIQLAPGKIYTGPFTIASPVTSVKVRGVAESNTYVTSSTIGFHLKKEATGWEFDGVNVQGVKIGWMVEGSNNNIHGLSQSFNSAKITSKAPQGPNVKATEIGIQIRGHHNKISTLRIESEQVGIEIDGSDTTISTTTVSSISDTGVIIREGTQNTDISTSTIKSHELDSMYVSLGSGPGKISTSTFDGGMGVTFAGDGYDVSTSTFMGGIPSLSVSGCGNTFSTSDAEHAPGFTNKCTNTVDQTNSWCEDTNGKENI